MAFRTTRTVGLAAASAALLVPLLSAPAAQALATSEPAATAVTLDVTIDAVSRVAPDGRAVVGGTVRCSGREAVVGGLESRVTQTRGHLRVAGSGYLDAPVCDGQARRWSTPVRGEAGLFGGGRALVQVWAYVCGDDGCANVELQKHVRLRRSA